MSVEILPSSFRGTCLIPPSKSHTMRAFLFASQIKGTSRIKNYLPSKDTESMIQAIQALGAEVRVFPDQIEIQGKVKKKKPFCHAGNSGQILRFCSAIAALGSDQITFDGDESIRRRRPIAPLLEGLETLGVTISGKSVPFSLYGPANQGTVKIEGKDSQLVSALLMMGAFQNGKTIIEVMNPGEKPWIDLTLSWLEKFSIPFKRQGYAYFEVEGGKELQPFSYTVPSDFSSLSFPLIGALITNSTLHFPNLDMEDVQGDKKLIFLLKQMGAKIIIEKNALTVFPSSIKGGTVDVNDTIDMIPILSVLGCFTERGIVIKNGEIARKKECDRIRCTKVELEKMGARIEERKDGLKIWPSSLKGADVFSHHDHRLAMSLVIAGLKAEEKTTLREIGCIDKSYPHFIDSMRKLGAKIS